MGNPDFLALTRQFHVAILDILAVMSNPQVDGEMVRAAGIPIDRALFPLLVSIERLGPLGIVELADRIGRDHTTVSRQVAKLEQLGLVVRKGNPRDRRIREAQVTPAGQAMTEAVDTARARIAGEIFETWKPEEVDDLVRLVRKLSDGMREFDFRSIPSAT